MRGAGRWRSKERQPNKLKIKPVNSIPSADLQKDFPSAGFMKFRLIGVACGDPPTNEDPSVILKKAEEVANGMMALAIDAECMGRSAIPNPLLVERHEEKQLLNVIIGMRYGFWIMLGLLLMEHVWFSLVYPNRPNVHDSFIVLYIVVGYFIVALTRRIDKMIQGINDHSHGLMEDLIAFLARYR